MVLETLLRKLMERYLANILDGVDHQEVSLQLLKGEVTLDDVKIKPSFLKSLALPFPFPLAFHRAVIHHLQLGVNWKLITSQPLLVKIHGVHLWAQAKAYDTLIGTDSAYVQHALAKAIQDKLDKLQREEEIRLAIAEFGDAEGTKRPSTIIARLIALVTTSLQLELNDLHVCISVPGVDQHPGLHMGLSVERLSFETSDSSWAEVPLRLITGPTYKSLSIRNVALYLNPDARADELAKDKQNANSEEATAKALKDLPALPTEALPAPRIAAAAEVAASLHHNHSVGPEERTPYQFLLKPMSLAMNMTFNKNIIPTVEVHAILDLPVLELTLTRPQVLTLRHLYEAVSVRREQVKKWIEKQPPHPPLTDFQQQRYMFLYKRTLNALWLPELDEAELKEKEELERELPYEELSLMRQAATLELKKELGSRDTISERADAIRKRTHWWDKLLRSEEGIKATIEDSAAPQHRLTAEQKSKILNKVRGEGTDEEELEEEDAFSLDDLMAMLTFHVSAELNVGVIGLELWHDKTTKDVPDSANKPSDSTTEGMNIIAVGAMEQRRRDDKEEATTAQPQQQPSQPQPLHADVESQRRRRRYAGEYVGEINLRPLLRLQFNKTTVGVELEPDGDVQGDASIDSIQLLDLTQCNASDPWSAATHSQDERVECGYIGPIVPHLGGAKPVGHAVLVDPSKPQTSQNIAPSSMPGGVVIRLRRSKDMLNSDQRHERLRSKATRKESSAKEHLTAPSDSEQHKDRSVTDIFFGTDPEDDKDSSAKQQQPAAGQKRLAPPVMFSHSVPVRSMADVQVNNVRLSLMDSLVELPDFIRAPPAPFSEKEKERMEKGHDMAVLDSAQSESDKQESAMQPGGEIRRDPQSIGAMADPRTYQEHQSDAEAVKQEPVRGVIEGPGQKDADKSTAQDKDERLKKEKEAVKEDVKVVPTGHGEQRSAAGEAGTDTEGCAAHPTVGDTKEDDVAKRPHNSLQFLSFFSPLLVRLHAPSPYISLIPDPAAKRLQRLTFSLNANARALLDGQRDSIHARAEVTNVRAWVARTEPVQAISLAPFHPPASDNAYVIRPFDIGLSFERFPSPLQQLLGRSSDQDKAEIGNIAAEFRKDAGEPADGLSDDDIAAVFEGEDAVYHMDADVDITAIHIKLAAKLWYTLQPVIQRVKKIWQRNDV